MKTLHRGLRRIGLHLQRWRDPFCDLRKFLHAETISHVVDGGAYQGSVSSRLAAVFPGATVHAFEPQPELLELIRRRFGRHSRIRSYEMALSDRIGESTFYVNEKAFTSSLLETLEPDVMKPASTRTVRTTTLDDWAEAIGILPDFIKLDLQGNELAALHGAQRSLEAGVKALLLEVNFRSRYEGCPLFPEVATYVGERDFRLIRLYEIINDSNGSWRQADALFVHRSVLE